MSEKYKTPEEILSDLEKISPLEISNYLIDTIHINKSIILEGNNLTGISLLNSSNVFFNVSVKENNSDLISLAIFNIDFSHYIRKITGLKR